MTLAVVGPFAALIVAAIAVWTFARPAVKRNGAVADAILGEEEVHDRAGGVLRKKQVGLVDRVGDLETAVLSLAEVVANQKELHELILTLQREQGMHGIRITSLERAAEERTEMHRQTTAFLNTVAERDTINGDVIE